MPVVKFFMFTPDSSDFGAKGHHPTTNAALHQKHIDVWRCFWQKILLGQSWGWLFVATNLSFVWWISIQDSCDTQSCHFHLEKKRDTKHIFYGWENFPALPRTVGFSFAVSYISRRPRTNMEPENTCTKKEHHLPKPSFFWVPAGKTFPGSFIGDT